MLTRIADLCFPGLNYNMAVTIMPDPLCNILLEGSSDLSVGENRAQGYKTFFMLISTEREMFPAHKC